MEKVSRKFVVVMLLVALFTLPFPTRSYAGTREGVTPCQAAGRWAYLAGFTAFGLAFVPGLQPVAAIYGAAAMGFRTWAFIVCE